MLEAGYAKVDITPNRPVPLAGYVTQRNRINHTWGDPICVRALYVKSGDSDACLVSVDCLIITEDIYREVHRRLAEQGLNELKCLIHAQHTHSSFGGYWEPKPAELFLKKYQPELKEKYIGGIVQAVTEAAASPASATLAYGFAEVKELNENRRNLEGGPIDPEMIVCCLTYKESGEQIVLVNYTGHPVIVAEKDIFRLSPDFPGRLCRKLEEKYQGALYFSGGLGGMSIAFPERITDCEEHLEFVAGGLFETVEKILKTPKTVKGKVKIDNRLDLVPKPKMQIRPLPRSRRLGNLALRPLSWGLQWFFSQAVSKSDVPLQTIRIGPLAFIGHPSDTGVSLALELKRAGRELGFGSVAVFSQCNDYAGYIHLPQDYAATIIREGEQRYMTIYENCMGYFGHDFGQVTVDRLKKTLAEIKP